MPYRQTNTEFHVNIDSILEGADYIGTMGHRMGGTIERYAFSIVKEVIVDVFADAVVEADAEDGFPYEFQQHVLEAAGRIVPTVFMDYNSIYVSVDLEEWMGGGEELKRAYHQGALLEGGGKLDGPYTGQALLNKDAYDRHIFWEALRDGDATYTKINSKTGKLETRDIKNAAGKWEETKRKYIEIWGEKAPEWLFIQFGQEEWEPYVTQVDILGRIQDSVNYMLTETLYNFIEREVAIANSYKATGIDVGFTKNNAVQLISPTATISGKEYRKGQFIPKKATGRFGTNVV